MFKMDSQEGPTVERREFCSMLCGSLDERRAWARMPSTAEDWSDFKGSFWTQVQNALCLLYGEGPWEGRGVVAGGRGLGWALVWALSELHDLI